MHDLLNPIGSGAEVTVSKPGTIIGVGIGIGFYVRHNDQVLSLTPISTPIPMSTAHRQRRISSTKKNGLGLPLQQTHLSEQDMLLRVSRELSATAANHT